MPEDDAATGKSDRAGPAAEPKVRTVPVKAARIAAIGAILAALIAGFFLLVQPLATKISDEYWNRTSEIRISDVRLALTADAPSLDVVLWNSTAVTQPVVVVEVGLAQEGLPLAMIGKSVYQLNGKLLTESGAVAGDVQGKDRVVYPFNGTFEIHARGAWALVLTIPVREMLEPGESRSVVFVVPRTIDVSAGSNDLVTRWLPLSTADRSSSVAGLTTEKFTVAEFLRGRGGMNLTVRAKRGDGKIAVYSGSITF